MKGNAHGSPAVVAQARFSDTTSDQREKEGEKEDMQALEETHPPGTVQVVRLGQAIAVRINADGDNGDDGGSGVWCVNAGLCRVGRRVEGEGAGAQRHTPPL